MPKALHERLARQAAELGLRGERRDAYVYGTMNKIENRKSVKRKAESGKRKRKRKRKKGKRDGKRYLRKAKRIARGGEEREKGYTGRPRKSGSHGEYY